MPGAIQQFVSRTLPSYLQKRIGRAFNRTFAQIGDDLRDTATFAFRESMIETATPDALPFHLRNSNLQVIPGESPAATLNVLRARWQIWRESGTVDAIVDALARLGFPNVEVWSALDLQVTAGIPGAFTTGGVIYQGFFFVLIKQPSGIGPGYHWLTDGKHWQTDGIMWGLSGITRSQLDDIIFAIQKFKHACSSCRFIAFDLDGTTKLDIPKWGNVQWNNFKWGAGLRGNYRTVACHEAWERQPDGAFSSLFNTSYLVP